MRKKFIFYGKVQGIGFRFRAAALAKQYNLIGWVENNKDGSVTLVVKGVKENTERLVDCLKDYFQDDIENIRVLTGKANIEKDEGLIDFEIK